MPQKHQDEISAHKNLLGRKVCGEGTNMNNSLEFFGTFCLPYVVTLQRQLAAHDLNEVFRKQPCEKEGICQKADTPAARAGTSVDPPQTKAAVIVIKM